MKQADSLELALIKEHYFINGLIALKNKVGGLHEKIDLNLLALFKFKIKYLGMYFLAHLVSLERKFKNIPNFERFIQNWC